MCGKMGQSECGTDKLNKSQKKLPYHSSLTEHNDSTKMINGIIR